MQLMQARNLRRNDAFQNLLGVSAEGLKTLFRQVRQALAVRGQRLVLLLEDITSWEGIDDSLIDVLVTNAGTRDDMCPLISVVGVTPAYYQKLHGNRSEEHTSELQSLMRISYADFCLKKQNTHNQGNDTRIHKTKYL